VLAPLAVTAAVVAFAALRDDGHEAGPSPAVTVPDAGTSLRTVFTAPERAVPKPGGPGGVGVGAPGAGEADYVPGTLIVRFVDGTSPDIARRVLARVDADLEASVDPLDLRVVEVPPAETRDALATVAASPAVEFVERDVVVRTFSTMPNDALWGEQWGPLVVDAPSAWDTARGSPSIIVAVLDTGVDATHPDLEASLVPGYDFVNGDADPADDEGYGTASGNCCLVPGFVLHAPCSLRLVDARQSRSSSTLRSSSRSDTGRVVAVRGDGAGSDAESSSEGQGLANMKLRAAAIDGEMSLRSVPGRGTAIEVVLRPV